MLFNNIVLNCQFQVSNDPRYQVSFKPAVLCSTDVSILAKFTMEQETTHNQTEKIKEIEGKLFLQETSKSKQKQSNDGTRFIALCKRKSIKNIDRKSNHGSVIKIVRICVYEYNNKKYAMFIVTKQNKITTTTT